MSRTAWAPESDPLIGLVTERPPANGESPGSAASIASGTDRSIVDVESSIADLGAAAVSGNLEDVLADEPSLLVTPGERALTEAASRARATPILPVGTVPGVPTIDRTSVEGALEAALDGGAVLSEQPLLTAETPRGRRDRGVFDVTLVTEEPAQISEYGVRSRDESIAQFRADGVVAATAAGSHGYASTVDGPLLSRAIDALVVVPIAPFVTRTRQWVLPDDELTLSVERDEDPVVLCVDDRSVERIPAGESVSVSASETSAVLTVPDSS
ncbi:NAD(+)/NADH kinase [Natrarchaeobius halalkaliphilus]|uniref:NAD(+)/NADH kinase n=1 Tax=Natrarchaeobius halalkaliphilus TaxID=1679091 RepID=A0A3N6LI71_9EURY|nr:NAD(+)/NADH kinase [Natrarchaeobius halalkaliphilus]RQG87004.1 NAD(+)/NADH kinase [Natrarchaeobius halalkaliphilus]